MLPETTRKKFDGQRGIFLREYGDCLIERKRGKKVVGSSTQPKNIEKSEKSMESAGDDIEENLSKW